MRPAHKRLAASLLACELLLSSAPYNVRAAGQTNQSDPKTSKTHSYIPEDGVLPDSTDLADAYAAQTLTRTRREYMGNLGEQMLNRYQQACYTELRSALWNIAAGKRASTSVTFTPETGLSNWTSSATGDALKQEIDSRCRASVTKLLNCLLADCPYELYWYDKQTGSSYSYAYNTTVLGDGQTQVQIIGLTVNFAVIAAYQGTAAYTVDTVQTGKATRAAQYAREIVSKYSDKSDREKLLAYKDEICALVEYDHATANVTSGSAYGDAWQMISVFDRDPRTNVVCEGYAKAFQYLCDLTEFQDPTIACYTVEGTLYETDDALRHMWNIVTVGEKNYLVDVSNSESDAVGANNGLFLVGTDGSIDGGYRFVLNGVSICYKYNSDAESIYGTKVLTISNSSYSS